MMSIIAAIAILLSPKGEGALAAALEPPAVAIHSGVTWVDEIGLYSVQWRGLDGATGAFPVGWSGMFDERTGVSATEFGMQGGRRAYLLHPMWRGQSGNADQSYRLALPKARAAHLMFGVAIGASAQGKSDGVTFRVFVDGARVFEVNTKSEAWTEADIDLSAKAGRTVLVTFETDPGPNHDPSFDFGIWGDRRVVILGVSPATVAPVGQSAYPLDAATAGWGACSPTYPVGVKPSARIAMVRRGKATDFAEGLRFAVSHPRGGLAPLELPMAHSARVGLVSADGKIVYSDDPSVHTETNEALAAGGIVRRITTYAYGGRTVRLTTEIHPYSGSSARIDVRSDDPYIASVDFGVIGPTAMRRNLVVPYLDNGTVQYLTDQGLYSSVFVDFARSDASVIDGVTAMYAPLTDGTRNPVRETAYFALSPDFASVLPTPPNPASPYRAALGDRVVLDHWRNVDFASNAAWLDLLASYGLTHFLTIAHVWQNGGYDNKLPDTLPAMESLGGSQGMRQWIAAAKRHGELIALHDNYADFYPNAASFDWANVPHDSEDKPIPAWKNLVQSYAVAPAFIVKSASIHEPQIAQELAPNAGYLDVHSSTAPSFHVDFRAGIEGAGMMRTVSRANIGLWSLTRRTYGGPVLGEGAHDWMWAGLLDGVEGQFGVGVPSNGGQSAPLFVDFALLKVHPRMLNHGMGYLERWLASPTASAIPASVLDQYRMQELIYGHAGFVANPLIDSLPFLWQEHNLVPPVTRRYAASPVRAIRYDVKGVLRDTNAAVAARSAFDRAQVTYANGLKITANGRNQPWEVAAGGGKVTLPTFGWVADGPDLLAYTALRGGRVVDFARTPTSIFANCRAVPIMAGPKVSDLKPSISLFRKTGARTFEIAFTWDVKEKVAADEAVFVHVVPSQKPDEIAFQIPAAVGAPGAWPIGRVNGQTTVVSVPADLPDGLYSIRVGIYSLKTGERLTLPGKDDGARRYPVGVLQIRDHGASVEMLLPPQRGQPPHDERVTRPAAPINFGPIATDESVMMDCVGGLKWRITPMPRDTPFTLAFDPADLGLHTAKLKIGAFDVAGKRLAGAIPVTASALGTRWRQVKIGAVSGAAYYELTSK
ncbi:DUF5696 domain-containing protein [Capsulimonas corticalis]|nr:DUF5696 domain-containing protein [Capsulimonas corticalis]